jgi:NADPH:quinone reductase-like Zn-dependent oxidoreductase
LRAAINNKYGPPEVVSVCEVARPVPEDDEVLVKVYASTVNRTDTGFRSAQYFISRFWSGLIRPRFKTLGCEFAGVIEEVGEDVTLFKKGDKVFGFNDRDCGGHAELLTIAEDGAVAHMPAGVGFDVAASITEGAHYALCDIRAAKIKSGANAMVYGATGAIGSAAVQLLKFFGVTVTAVCNTRNVELVRSLGADVVIDYEKQEFTKTGATFEFIFDAVGKSSFSQCKPLLTDNGIYVSTELGKGSVNVFLALVTPFFGRKKVLFPIPTINKEDVIFLKGLVETGRFRPVIDRTYSLDQIVEAHRYVESGQKTGNVVIEISGWASP